VNDISKLPELISRKVSKYGNRNEVLNAVYLSGSFKRNSIMILDMLLMGNGVEKIKNTLLFTDAGFDKEIEELISSLDKFNSSEMSGV